MNGFAEDAAPAYEPPPMTKAAFLAWLQRQQGRYELKDGRVIMHPGSTRRHGRISLRFATAFAARLDPLEYSITSAEFAVEIGDDIRYPDVLVEYAAGEGTDLTTEAPLLLIEVLSPSSVGTDMKDKLSEYTAFESLQAYIVASQDAAIVYVWQRDPVTKTFPAIPLEIAGFDRSISLAALNLEIPLAEIYRGIVAA